MSGPVLTPSGFLPLPFLVIYTLPLLVLSLPLIICGAFVTLDRTHTFSPKSRAYDILATRPSSLWRLDGGMGGATVGFVFGIHLITILVLVFENHATARQISPGGFLALWFIFALIFSFVCGRWKIPALATFAICGGSATALFIAVISHPSLVTRLVFLFLFVLLFLLGTFLPVQSGRLQPWFIRTSAAFTGSTTLVIAIALLRKIDGWGHALLRFVIHSENTWGGSKERGLSAAVVFFFLIGVVSDKFLSKKFGRDPSENWDNYLSEYAHETSKSRGVFRPFPPLFRCCSRAKQPREVLFPPDTAYTRRVSRPARFLPYQATYAPGILQRPSDTSLAMHENTGFIRPPRFAFRDISAPSLSGATIVDVDKPRHLHLHHGPVTVKKEIGSYTPPRSIFSSISTSDVFDSDEKHTVGVSTSGALTHDGPDRQMDKNSAHSLSIPPTLLKNTQEMNDTSVEYLPGTSLGAATGTVDLIATREEPRDMREETNWEDFWRNVHEQATRGK